VADIEVLLRTIGKDLRAEDPGEEPVVRYDAGMGFFQEPVGMRGLSRAGVADEAEAGARDVDAGTVHREDVVLVFEDVAGKAEGERLDPPVIFDIEEEGSPGLRIVQDGVGPIVRILENEHPPVRADILGHGVKILLPGIPDHGVIREELDAAAIDLGLDLVTDLRHEAIGQALLFIRGDEGNTVGHNNIPRH